MLVPIVLVLSAPVVKDPTTLWIQRRLKGGDDDDDDDSDQGGDDDDDDFQQGGDDDEALCANTNDCPAGQQCVNGACAAVSLIGCKANNDCAKGQTCTNGACVTTEIVDEIGAVKTPGYSPATTEKAPVHADRAAQIEKINGKATTWKAAAHPRFASEAPGASATLLGAKGNWAAELRDSIKMGEIVEYVLSPTLAAAPDSFDSATNWPDCAKTIGDIRDQSNCGCSWAFGGAEAASDRMCIATKASLLMPLSAQDVCFNAGGNFSSGCNGGQISTPWSFIKETGAVTGGQYQNSGPFASDGPFCSQFSLPPAYQLAEKRVRGERVLDLRQMKRVRDNGPGRRPRGQPGCPSESSPPGPKKCDSDAVAGHSDFMADKYTFSGQIHSASGPANIKAMIMEGGPVETAFTVYSDLENYAGGVYKHTTGSPVDGHAVKIVGWGTDSGTDYWKVANSWGPYWGEDGYFRIAFGEGGIDDQVVGSSASAIWSKKV